RRRDAQPPAGLGKSPHVGDGHENAQLLNAIHWLRGWSRHFQIGNRVPPRSLIINLLETEHFCGRGVIGSCWLGVQLLRKGNPNASLSRKFETIRRDYRRWRRASVVTSPLGSQPRVTSFSVQRSPPPRLAPGRTLMEIKGKTVLVTGASSGVGAAIAKEMALAGAGELLLLARNENELKKVAAAIASLGGKARIYPVDLSNPDQVTAIAQRI